MIRPNVPEADAARRIDLRWVRANGAKVKIKKTRTRSASKIRRVKRLGWMVMDRASANDVLGGKTNKIR
jgi:hypothetical protein